MSLNYKESPAFPCRLEGEQYVGLTKQEYIAMHIYLTTLTKYAPAPTTTDVEEVYLRALEDASRLLEVLKYGYRY